MAKAIKSVYEDPRYLEGKAVVDRLRRELAGLERESPGVARKIYDPYPGEEGRRRVEALASGRRVDYSAVGREKEPADVKTLREYWDRLAALELAQGRLAEVEAEVAAEIRAALLGRVKEFAGRRLEAYRRAAEVEAEEEAFRDSCRAGGVAIAHPGAFAVRDAALDLVAESGRMYGWTL